MELNAVRLRFIAIYGCLTVMVCVRRVYPQCVPCVKRVTTCVLAKIYTLQTHDKINL